MNHPYHSLDPPPTLRERLTRLHDNLQALGERLKASIASVVADAVAEAVRDAVRRLLGERREPVIDHFHDPRDHFNDRDDRWDDGWGEDRRWADEDDYHARETPTTRTRAGQRWRSALSAALQACLWFLRRQPRRRPVLTTVCVTLAAGVTAFVAGPALAAVSGVLASAASLMLTAEASRSASEFAAD
jgi:hypothetical protein